VTDPVSEGEVPRGSLTIVGTGIRPPFQTTHEAIRCIEQADRVLYLLDEPTPARWIRDRNPSTTSLAHLYLEHDDRSEVYDAIVAEVMGLLGEGLDVCLALYGHPGVFVSPSHEALSRAREAGYRASMLPGVSAEDCLFVDLGFDPADAGCQSYEATDFLIHERIVDPSVPLILWQISVIGDSGTTGAPNRTGLRELADRLTRTHGVGHRVTIYEASPFPFGRPLIDRVRVGDLAEADVPALSTLFVPPAASRAIDPDVVRRLGMSGPRGD